MNPFCICNVFLCFVEAAQRLAVQRRRTDRSVRVSAQNQLSKCERSWGRVAASAGTPDADPSHPGPAETAPTSASSVTMLSRQKLTPEHALERPSPCSNLVPQQLRPRDWWQRRSPADDPDEQAVFPTCWGWRLFLPLLYSRCVMTATRPSAQRRRLEDLTSLHPNAAGTRHQPRIVRPANR
jgi:hypothetical protein